MTALVPDRACDACAVCCRALAIEALSKPAGPLCRHSTGTACGIYPDRPHACARWYCLWRRIGALPEGLRPDRSGVLFSLESRSPDPDASDGACIVGRVVGRTGEGDRRDVAEAFAMFVRDGGWPVWRVSGRRAVRLRPEPPPGAVGGDAVCHGRRASSQPERPR